MITRVHLLSLLFSPFEVAESLKCLEDSFGFCSLPIVNLRLPHQPLQCATDLEVLQLKIERGIAARREAYLNKTIGRGWAPLGTRCELCTSEL